MRELYPLGTEDVIELGIDAAGDEIVFVAIEADPTVRNWRFLRHCAILLSRLGGSTVRLSSRRSLTRKAGRVQF
jgi:hypothetical protein